ncbi:MAG: DUF3263 domain-containing protein [Propionibacteriaceae bacterium]|nr:DUF3263 domain-containing protein [Propionibacteriaceae bacterium]
MSDANNEMDGCELTLRERALLDFEASWWRSRSPKADQIRTQFALSAPRYYQIVNALIDRPEALAYNPVLVQRLRRLREQRRFARSGARVAPLR